MTWNVENLFRPGGMAGVTDPALYEQKLANLASMISTYRPDVIGLQEIGDPGALDDLKNKLGARVGFANSGGLVFMDESAEAIPTL
jgi:hypothetical protein